MMPEQKGVGSLFEPFSTGSSSPDLGPVEKTPDPFLQPDSLGSVLTALLEMLEQGQAPDRKTWTNRFPQFATELEEFFTSREHFEPWAAPLRSVARALLPTPRPDQCA